MRKDQADRILNILNEKMRGPDGKEMSMPFEGAGMTGFDNLRKV